MTNNNLSLKKIAAATGLFLGAFALSAFAGDWTPAGCPAPGCNTAAPINVSNAAQYKEGSLAVGKSSGPANGFDLDVGGNANFAGSLITTGLSVSGLTDTLGLRVGGANANNSGYVLTNDGTGIAEWKAASASSVVEPTFYSINTTGSVRDYTLGRHSLCAFSGDHVGNNTVVGDQTNSLKRNDDGTWVVNISPNGTYLNARYPVGVYCI